MKNTALTFWALAGIVLWLAGCQVSDKGQLTPNEPPTATLTFAPQDGDTVNHYIPIHWSGNDQDGNVVGFQLIVDTDTAMTTSFDSTIAFYAPEDSVVVFHTIAVRAIDDKGAMSTVDDQSSRSFYTINYRPTAVFDPSGSVPNNSQVGTGFRMTLTSEDPNPSRNTFCLSIDDTNSWICSEDSIFLLGSQTLHAYESDVTIIGFDDDHDGRIDEEIDNGRDDDGDGLIDEDCVGLIPDHTVMVSNERLVPDSAHVIYARVIDAGGAESPIISRTINVQSDRVPFLDSTVTGTYGGNDLYADGSVYFDRNAETTLTFSARAVLYLGEINAYRYQLEEGGPWSDWDTSPDISLSDLPAGDYPVRMVARDIAKTSSNIVEFHLRIVEQHLTRNVVIVDETRTGTGNPGSPTDAQVDDFYDSLFVGYNTTQVDFTTPGHGFVSPNDLKDAGLVMWHSDDFSDIRIGQNTRILSEYVNKGGRVIVSGWDIMSPFTGGADSMTFSTTSNTYRYFRAISAARIPAGQNLGSGLIGDNGYPSVTIDSLKLPPSWHGGMNKVWTFRPRGEDITIGRMNTLNGDANPLYNRPAAYIYDLSFRVAMFGIPLYFCKLDEVEYLFRNPDNGVIEHMLEGL